MKNSIFIGMLIAIILSFISCEQTKQPLDDQSNNPLITIIPDQIYNTIADSVTGPIDGIQIIAVDESMVNHGPQANGEDNNYHYYTNAIAAYRVGNASGQIVTSSCWSINLQYETSMLPYRYNKKWQINQGPSLSDNVNWSAVISNETIRDTIPIPNGFSNLSFSSQTIDLGSGGTLSWSSTSNADVSVNIMWAELDSTQSNVKRIQYKHMKIVSDNGSCVISSNELSQIPDNVSVVTFYLLKGNIKTKLFDSGNKQMLTMSWVERGINIKIENE